MTLLMIIVVVVVEGRAAAKVRIVRLEGSR